MNHFTKELQEEVQKQYPLYIRWINEGKPVHGSGGQYYYDSYHNHISEEKIIKGSTVINKLFYFSFQTYDGPDGDTWVRGNFVIIGNLVYILNYR